MMGNRPVISRLLLVVAILAASATALAQKITAEFDESVNFARFKTFAIRVSDVASKSPALNSELTRKRIETELERALVAKGLTRTTGRADLDVSFSLGADPGTKAERRLVTPRGGRARTVQVPDMQGTLVIDIKDPSTRELVWRGVAMADERDPAKLAARLDDMVKKTVAKYPRK